MNLARLLMIDLSDSRLSADERAFLEERQPGGVCLFGRNVEDAPQLTEFVAELRSLAGPGLLVAVDPEGGGGPNPRRRLSSQCHGFERGPVHVAAVSEHEAVLAALDQALGKGRLDPAALEALLGRVNRLTRDFPATPAAYSRGLAGDKRLLEEAAHGGLVSLGHLPELVAGSKVLLVAAGAVRQGAATQATIRPAEALAAALEERGLEVVELEYDPDAPLALQSVALAAAEGCDHLLFASTSRTPLTSAEQALGRILAAGARGFLHVALWNPYAVSDLPGPALVTFGWRERSARAAAAALCGQAATGLPPVPLRTFDDLER